MVDKVEELKKDIAELQTLEQQAVRQKVKDIFTIEIRKLVSDVLKQEEILRNQSANYVSPSGSSFDVSAAPSSKKYEVKLNNYAWDQTDKFVKFYVTINNVQTIPAENVHCEFGQRNLGLTIKDLDNKDYAFQIKNLLKKIDPGRSNWRIKSDMVIINAAKTSPDHWSHVTELEKRASDKKTPNMDTDKLDPTEGLMSLMKNMYDKGDDEMKRTIAKAWTESQAKGAAF